MDLRAPFPDETFQPHEAQDCPPNDHGIGENHRYPVRDGAAQNDQGKRRRLEDKVNHPKGRAGVTVSVLPPQQHNKPYADNVRDQIAEDDGSHV